MNLLSRRERIIISAIDIIDRDGISNLTIRKLAKSQGISEAAIYRHFKSKNDIVIEVINKFAQYDEAIYRTIDQEQLSPIKSIIFLVENLAQYYENYPQITSIFFSSEIYKYNNDIAEKMNNVMNKRYEKLLKLVDKGQQSGSISSVFGKKDLVIAINGFIVEKTLRWRNMHTKYGLKKNVVNFVKKLLYIDK